MSTPAIPPLSLLGATPTPAADGRDPARARDAAQQFEALLIGQMLRGVRESGSGWLGSGEDSAGDCATDFAEQQFAAVMARNGGLGLANLIAAGLEK
jgi:Rod binding domain-containing protein